MQKLEQKIAISATESQPSPQFFFLGLKPCLWRASWFSDRTGCWCEASSVDNVQNDASEADTRQC